MQTQTYLCVSTFTRASVDAPFDTLNWTWTNTSNVLLTLIVFNQIRIDILLIIYVIDRVGNE